MTPTHANANTHTNVFLIAMLLPVERPMRDDVVRRLGVGGHGPRPEEQATPISAGGGYAPTAARSRRRRPMSCSISGRAKLDPNRGLCDASASGASQNRPAATTPHRVPARHGRAARIRV